MFKKGLSPLHYDGSFLKRHSAVFPHPAWVGDFRVPRCGLNACIITMFHRTPIKPAFLVGVWWLLDLEILENGRCYTSGLHWCFSLSPWQAFFFPKSTANHPVRVRYPMVVQFNLVQQVPSWDTSYFFSNQPFRCCFTQNSLGYFWEELIIRGESSKWVSVLPGPTIHNFKQPPRTVHKSAGWDIFSLVSFMFTVRWVSLGYNF